MSPKEEISAEFGCVAKDVQELVDAMDSPGFYHRNAVPERASEVPDKTEEGEGAGGGNQKPKPANPKAKTKAKAKPGVKAKAKSKASKDIPFFLVAMCFLWRLVLRILQGRLGGGARG